MANIPNQVVVYVRFSSRQILLLAMSLSMVVMAVMLLVSSHASLPASIELSFVPSVERREEHVVPRQVAENKDDPVDVKPDPIEVKSTEPVVVIPPEPVIVESRQAEPDTKPPEQPEPTIVVESTPVTTVNATQEAQSTTTRSSCLRHNSDAWLNGIRIGNTRDLTKDMVKQMIVDFPSVLRSGTQNSLGQSVCHEKSRFRNANEVETDKRSLRLWAVRLIYLAIHYHQHKPALEEARARFEDEGCEEELRRHDIGPMDFECPNAKFLAISLADIGLGANIRSGTSAVLVAALATNRQLILINNVPKEVNYKYAKNPWQLASCDRQDFQCFFMPTSPCVLTAEDLNNGHVLTGPEQRKLLKRGEAPVGYEDNKVWMMTLSFLPPLFMHKPVLSLLQEYARELIHDVPEGDARLPALNQAVEVIAEKDEDRPNYNYAAASLKIPHTAAIYSMRPNPTSNRMLEAIMNEIAPKDVDPENAFGLPVRASDKCKGESDCLSFNQHMEVVSQYWRDYQKLSGTTVDPVVVFTTEATSMVAEQQAFVANETLQATYPYRFTFIANTKDVTPDTGFISEATGDSSRSITADEAMLSSISSLKLQLHGRVTAGNCCSNFHILLGDLLMEGCGAAQENTFICLQENENPALQVCCGWHKDCQERKKAYFEEVEKNRTAALLETTPATDLLASS